jgi:hypothetical protein
VLKTPAEAALIFGDNWWTLTTETGIVAAQFPITLSYNLRQGSKVRICFGDIALQSLDGREVWNTRNRKRKFNAAAAAAAAQDTVPLPKMPARSIFCNEL